MTARSRSVMGPDAVQSWHQGTLVEEIELAIARMDEHPWGWMTFTRHDGVLHEAVAGSGVPIEEHLKIFTSRLAKDR